MHLRSLKHLVDIVRAVSQADRIVIIGSSSLLAANPELGEAGQPLETSYDSDLLLSPINEELAAMLGEAVGQQSLFAKSHGYYADILRPVIGETLPAGWESRLHVVPGYNDVFSLDPYDLALVKLVLGREKDLELLCGLLRLGIIEAERLRQHYRQAPLHEREAFAASRNLHKLLGSNS